MVQPIDPSVGNFVLRNLSENQFDLGRTLERLSTGLRVNRAADDPSGIPRIESLKSALLSNNQARLNNQASALMGATAEDGALQILNQLQRLREITLESLNDTTNDSDRSRLQGEFGKLTQEIDRVARNTSFNGRNLLDGSTAAGSSTVQASASLLSNRKLTDSALGINSAYFDSNVSVDGNATGDVRFQFRLFNASSSLTTGLEISSSNQGVLATYSDWGNVPLSLTLPLNGSSGPSLYLNRMAFALPSTPSPLTSAELNTPLQTLVANGRIDAVTYGNLALTAGGQVFSSVLNVTGSSTLNDVLTAINGLSNAQGTFNASFDNLTSKITVGYTGTGQATSVSNQTYTPTVPGAAGGPFSAFALITPASLGPAYRDPSSYLPGTGFGVASAQTYFPTLPAAVDASLSFTGSDASLVGLFGLTGQSGRGLVSNYTSSYYGETVATGNQSEYVNRTRLSIDSVTATQAYTSNDSGLTAADLDKTFSVLSGTVLDAANFSTGDFSINFGDNGIFTYNSLNPASNSLQDIVNAINTYGGTVGNRVSASFDAGTDLLTISNTAQALPTNSKVTDPGLSSGAFSIDFGSNGVFNYNLNLGSTTIGDLVTALNAFNPNVAASFDASTDTFSLNNQVSPAYDTKVTDPGLTAGTLSINFGDNGTFTTAFNNATTIQGLVGAINTYGGTQGNRVSASYDPSTDKLSLSNTANPIFANKVTSPSVGAGTFTIDFGENSTFSYNFNPGTDTIQSVVNAIDAVNNVTASFDASTDKLTIVNTASSGTAVTGTKVTAPGLTSGTFSIDFGSNGTFTTAFDPNSTSINGLVNAINNYSTTSAGGRIAASYNDSTDQLTITNTGAPGYDSKIANPGLSVGGTLNVDYGSNGTRSVTLTNSTTIQDVVNALAAPGVTVSYNETSDTLNFSNVASGPSSTSDTKVTNPPLNPGTFSIDFGNGRVYSYAFDPNTTTIQGFQNDLNAWGASRGIAAGYDSNTDQFTITNTPQISTDTKINDAPFGVATNFTIDFGSNGILDLTGIDGRNESIQSYVNRINAYGATQGGRVSASFDTGTDRLTISNTPLNGSTPTYDTKIDGSPLGTGTFSIDFGTNGTLNFGTVNGGDYSINSFLDAINNYTGEQAGGSVSASYDAANDRIVISNTSVDQPGGAAPVSDPGFVDGGSLTVRIEVSPGFSGYAAPVDYTYSGNLLDASVNDIVNWLTSIGSPRDFNASFDTANDKIFIDVGGVNANPLDHSMIDTRITFIGANATPFQDFFALNLVTAPIEDFDGTLLGYDYHFESTGDIAPSIDLNENASIRSLITGSPATPGNNQIHISDTNTGLQTVLRLGNADTTGTGTQTYYGSDIDKGTTNAALNLDDAGDLNKSLTTLGTEQIVTGSTPVPGNNQIKYFDIGSGFHTFFQLPVPGPDNNGSGLAQSVSSAGDVDKSFINAALDIGAGDLNTALSTLASAPVTIGVGSNQISINDGGTGLAAFFRLSSQGNTGSGAIQATVSAGDIDKSSSTGYGVLDITGGDFTSTSLASLVGTQIVTSSTAAGTNPITFTDSSGLFNLFKLASVGSNVGGASGSYTQTTGSSATIDKGGQGALLDVTGGDVSSTPIVSLVQANVQTSTGSNAISFNDGGTGLTGLFKLANGSGSVTSSADIDNGSTSALLNIDNAGVDAGKTLKDLATTSILIGGTPGGNNQITFGGTSNLQNFFKLSSVASNGLGGANTAVSSADIDNSTSNGLLDIGGGDVGATTINSLLTGNVQIAGGDNRISIGGGTGLENFFQISSLASTGSGSQTTTSAADIDKSAAHAILDVTGNAAGTDYTNTSIFSLAQTPVLYSGGNNDSITFSAGLGQKLRDFFKLADQGNNASATLSGTYNRNTTSSAAIDNGGNGSPYDIVPADVSGQTFQNLITPFALGLPNNQILFTGALGAELRDIFNLSDVASDGTTNPRLSVSSSQIDNGAVDASLELNAGQVSGSTLGQLLTPRLSTLISGPLVIDGGTVININPASTTLNQVISAINSYAGPSHKTYAASFSNGRLVFNVTDTETLTPTGGTPVAIPGEATPRLNGNDLIFDSAAYIAQDAPKTVGGVPLNPTGTGPAEQAYSSTALDSRYSVTNPAAPANLSNLVFGGTTNLASVLYLPNAGNANVSGPTVTGTDYQGVISALGPNSYQLQASTRQNFTASSASTSTQGLGNPYTNRLNDNQTGVIAELEITGQTAAQQDHALGFQFGRNEGNTESFGFSNLTAESLRLEGLSLTGANSLQTRLRGNHVLNVLDKAIETTLSQISHIGAFENSANRQDEAIARDSETLASSLSNHQDADIASEISHLTHQQVVAQAGIAALAEQENNAEALYNILFGNTTTKQTTTNNLLKALNGSLLDSFR